MKTKKLLRWMLCSVLLLVCFSGKAFAENPARVIMGFYAREIQAKNTIEPYIISILALNEVKQDRHLPEVREFLLWYLDHLNAPDHYGLTGTIYVYTWETDRLVSTNKYDSVDGYAGLFLHLLHRYVVKTGDRSIPLQHWDKIEEIARLIPRLQDRDGLTWAHPGHKAKYLMDNSEAYGGIGAYLALGELTGKNHSAYFSIVHYALKAGIFRELYEDGGNLFAWAVVENKILSRSTWDTFYPDAFAQLFPLYYELMDDRPAERQRLWQEFNRHFAAKIESFPIEQQILYQLTRAKLEGR